MSVIKIKKCKICDIELNETNRARQYLKCVECHSIQEYDRHRTYRILNSETICIKNKEYKCKNKELIKERNHKKLNQKYGYDEEKFDAINKEYDDILPKMTELYNYLDKPLNKREMTPRLKENCIRSYNDFLDWLKVLYNSDAEEYKAAKDRYKNKKALIEKEKEIILI